MFEIKADKAQWSILYDHLVVLEIGDVVKYEQLVSWLPDASENSVRGAFYRAVQQIEDDRHRTFDCVRGVGYRMVAAAEHERLARGQHLKAKRRLRSAWRKAHSADRSLLTQEERRRLDAVENHLGRQREMIRRLETKVERLESGLQAARREVNTNAAEVNERLEALETLLARHGITADVKADAA